MAGKQKGLGRGLALGRRRGKTASLHWRDAPVLSRGRTLDDARAGAVARYSFDVKKSTVSFTARERNATH